MFIGEWDVIGHDDENESHNLCVLKSAPIRKLEMYIFVVINDKYECSGLLFCVLKGCLCLMISICWFPSGMWTT